MSEPPERPRFCPFCGTPVGSFFGRHGVDGTAWCERCDGWFTAERRNGEDGDDASGNDRAGSGR